VTAIQRHRRVPKKYLGYHTTPPALVRRLARNVVAAWCRGPSGAKGRLRVADFFAGDGRLGRAVAQTLHRRGYEVDLTLVEVDRRRYHSDGAFKGERWLYRDVFHWSPRRRYDIIVANPPYLRLTTRVARIVGIPWPEVSRGGDNLYGIGMLRCVAACRPSGVVGLVGPFGWTTGYRATGLRLALNELCRSVVVKGLSSRSVFAGVHQDASVTVCKRAPGKKKGSISVSVARLKGRRLHAPLHKRARVEPVHWSVHCGTVVWNRMIDSIGPRRLGRLALVYGGNIGLDGRLCLTAPRYKDRQYIVQAQLHAGDIVCGPALLLRRVMAGQPGRWRVVTCLLGAGEAVAVENHVIVVKLKLEGHHRSLRYHVGAVRARLERFFRFTGQPCLSVRAVRAVVQGVAINRKGVRAAAA
jgi:hypothetical protein